MTNKSIRDARKELGTASRMMSRKRRRKTLVPRRKRVKFSDWTRRLRRSLRKSRRKSKKR